MNKSSKDWVLVIAESNSISEQALSLIWNPLMQTHTFPLHSEFEGQESSSSHSWPNFPVVIEDDEEENIVVDDIEEVVEGVYWGSA